MVRRKLCAVRVAFCFFTVAVGTIAQIRARPLPLLNSLVGEVRHPRQYLVQVREIHAQRVDEATHRV